MSFSTISSKFINSDIRNVIFEGLCNLQDKFKTDQDIARAMTTRRKSIIAICKGIADSAYAHGKSYSSAKENITQLFDNLVESGSIQDVRSAYNEIIQYLNKVYSMKHVRTANFITKQLEQAFADLEEIDKPVLNELLKNFN